MAQKNNWKYSNTNSKGGKSVVIRIEGSQEEICMLSTVKPYLSGPQLSAIFTYADTFLVTNYDYLYRKTHFSGQSA